MGLLYQKRRLKVNKIKRQISTNRIYLLRLKGLFAFAMCVGICYFSYKVFNSSYWFINQEKLTKADPSVIKIQGNIITPSHKVINMVRQTNIPNVQIFRLDTKELENNISQLQPVKKVYVRRYWFPARLTITLEERVPAFLLAPNLESEPNAALSTDGILIDHEYLPLNPILTPKKLLTYGVRNGYDEAWDKEKVESLLKVTRAIEAYSNQQVQYIDIRNEKDVYIMLEKYLIRFGEINATALNRARKIASILPEAQKYDLKYIDLRWDDTPYFRLKDEKEVPKKENQKIIEKQAEKTDENTNVQEQKSEEKNEKKEDITEIKEENKQVVM